MSFTHAYRVQLDAVLCGYDRKTCWVQARAGAIPGPVPSVVMTMQKLRLTGSDIFYALNEMRTDDLGKTWTGPIEHRQSLGRRPEPGAVEAVPCDFNPKWHQPTAKLLGTGHTARYLNDELMPDPRPRDIAYSVYNAADRTWTPWDVVQMPKEDFFFSVGAGSAQRWDLPDGTILLPVYTKCAGDPSYQATVIRCAFDGRKLTYIEHGDRLTCPEPRGFCEPSLTCFQGRYYLTLRNDIKGYVTVSDDGLHWQQPRPWCFDLGMELGNYNTQQHWITHPAGLYLVYTRRTMTNDHVFRHRAPLFIAKVNPDTLTVMRNTEQILVPERGARLGNFQVTDVSDKETWVTVTEWMQTNPPNPHDCTVCEKYGSDNTVWAARLFWD